MPMMAIVTSSSINVKARREAMFKMRAANGIWFKGFSIRRARFGAGSSVRVQQLGVGWVVSRPIVAATAQIEPGEGKTHYDGAAFRGDLATYFFPAPCCINFWSAACSSVVVT